MNPADLVVIAIVVCAVVLALRQMIRRHKNGCSCCGGCGAGNSCNKCHHSSLRLRCR